MKMVIVGAGPAGLTAARVAISRGCEILVIDRGVHPNPSYSTANIPPGKESAPTGGIGGTARIWSGQLIPLMEKDFATGDFDHLISRASYGKHVSEVYSWFKLRKPRLLYFRAIHSFPKIRHRTDYSLVLKNPQLERYFLNTIRQIKSSILYREVSRFEVDANSSVCLVFMDGSKLDLNEEDVVILAAGTMGNTRILLSSDLPQQVKNLGKNLSDHPSGYVGRIRPKHLYGAYRAPSIRLAPNYSLRIKHLVGLESTSGYGCFEIHPHKSPIQLKELRNSVKVWGWSRVVIDIAVRLTNFFLGILPFQTWRIAQGADVWMQFEQVNRLESRVVLDGRNFQYEWGLGCEDLDNYNRNLAEIERILAPSCGNIDLDYLDTILNLNNWAILANHPSGTVSDKDVISHGGISSLLGEKYRLVIAGGAILPRSSWVNPTLTIMAITAFGVDKIIRDSKS